VVSGLGEVTEGQDVLPEIEHRNRIRATVSLLRGPLPTEAELTANWPADSPVVVSVICATYNHAPLVDDALRGFMCQQTDFRFEVIVRDDASTDGTQQILHEYAERYPKVIRLVLHERNTFSAGQRPVYEFPDYIRGEFVAICQGDDFWTRADKLQRQVDQLRRRPDCIASMAATLVCDVALQQDEVTGVSDSEMVYPGLPTRYHHPSSYLIRAGPYIEIIRRYFIPTGLYGDTPLRRFLAHYGRICTLPEVVSVYWVNQKGIWSGLSEREQAEQEFINSMRIIRVAPLGVKRAELSTVIANGSRLAQQARQPAGVRGRLAHLPYLPFVAIHALMQRLVSARSARRAGRSM